MFRFKTVALAFGFLFLLTAVNSRSAFAQTTLSNIPTTDVVAAKKVDLDFQYELQVPAPDVPDGVTTPRASIYIPRVTVGVGRNVEVGANVSFFHVNGTNRTDAFLSPNVKWKFYDNETHGLAASGGAILFTPLNHRSESDTFGMVYTNFSKQFKATYGPRLTAGVYGIVGQSDAQFLGPRSGALLGFEQPIYRRTKIVADWISGKNGFGYFTPGVQFTFQNNSRLNVGYSFGNDSFSNTDGNNDNRFLFVKYGITF
jgi:hypothetical protein